MLYYESTTHVRYITNVKKQFIISMDVTQQVVKFGVKYCQVFSTDSVTLGTLLMVLQHNMLATLLVTTSSQSELR